jgi:hypothetical protein
VTPKCFEQRIALWLLVILGSLTALAAPADAPHMLKSIDNSGGGQIVYGPTDEATPQAAMASALRYVHKRFEDRPIVGKVFQSRDGQNLGAFFTLVDKPQNNKPMAGLVIVSLANGSKPAAAVLYDISSRFASTEPALLRALTSAWRTQAMASPAPSSASTAGAVPVLTPTPFPDGSGAVKLPAGWRIAFASHGAAKIVGPRGELVLLSNSFGPIFDPNNPQFQARMRYANRNNPPLLCPSGDALQTYQCLLQRSVPQPSFELKKSQPLQPRFRAVQAVLIDAELDLHDGNGVLSCELGLSITGVGPLGDRTLGINGTCAPRASLAQELPTLKAVYDSYSMNGHVVESQYAADAQRSVAAGNAARAQANAAHAAEDARSAQFQAHMDNIDRFSRSFQNYQLDQTELQDNNLNARGAIPNSLADALIKAEPDRFQAVPAQDFFKGVDF